MSPLRQLCPYLAASCIVCAAPLAASVQGEQVVEVRIEGLRRVAPQRILAKLATQPGLPLDEALINDDVRIIERDGPFTNATKLVERLDDGGIRVIFQVRELPYVTEVRFEGLSYVARQAAAKKLRIRRGGWLNPLLLEADRLSLLEHLRGRKHLDARVEAITDIDDKDGLASVTWRISTGTQVAVARVDYPGLPRATHPFLLDRNLLNRPSATFQPDMLWVDRAAVERALWDLGWLDARVREVDVDRYDRVRAYEDRARRGPALVPEGQRDDRVALTFDLEPGQRYRLRSVRFTGDLVVDEATLRQTFGVADGAWFERPAIEGNPRDRSSGGKAGALRVVRNLGYARAFFVEERIADPQTLSVDLTLRLVSGDRHRIGRVDISGNTITRDAVIRRDLRLLPGELWSDDARAESERQLLRTGLFTNTPDQPLRIAPLFESSRPVDDEEKLSDTDVLVDLIEEQTGRFAFNIGFSSAIGVVGQVTFEERNFDLLGLLRGETWRGAGQRLNAGITWSNERTTYNLGWTNPRLMDSPYSLGVDLRRSESSAMSWDEKRQSAAVTVGRNLLNNDLRLRLRYSYTDLGISSPSDTAPDAALDGRGSYHLNTVMLSQEYTRLNHPMFPTQGWRVELTEELNGLIIPSSADYLRLQAEADIFLPLARHQLGGSTYLRFSQRWRQLEAIGDTDTVPYYDRLYGGGPAPRHRGFRRFDLGPTEINSNGNTARSGGTREWMTTLELSYPVEGTDQGLRLVAFTDIGQVWAERETVDLGELRSAIGLGIRFPQAFPIALDFAWLIDPGSNEDARQFHFSIAGLAF